jgi:uncharacterized RDD family membrane protein YckC
MSQVNQPPKSAGFWRRLAAAGIDAIVLMIIGCAIQLTMWVSPNPIPGRIFTTSNECAKTLLHIPYVSIVSSDMDRSCVLYWDHISDPAAQNPAIFYWDMNMAIEDVFTSAIATVAVPLLGAEICLSYREDCLCNGFEDSPSLFIRHLMFIFLLVIGGWLYYAFLESSAKQATIGKQVMRLIVADRKEQKISFMRATARYFSKMLWLIPSLFILCYDVYSERCGFPFEGIWLRPWPALSLLLLLFWLLGYVRIGRTKTQQPPHDKIAGCMVIRA